ncbi:hypothetical protein AC249_AIPGENE2602 [Exaiptasia diaphana]|nr:hypothetical protein AC249_AIPGENE2602 [Exaiptasia diaphana]
MVKSHNIRLKISNAPNSRDMKFVRSWFDSGRLGNSYSWPSVIKSGNQVDILCYESDWSMAGCSGYVTYRMLNTDITIGFSNPSVGNNKLGVGTTGHKVWDDMSSNDYKPFSVNIDSGNGNAKIQFDCQCTNGDSNICTVNHSLPVTLYEKLSWMSNDTLVLQGT